MSKSRKSAIVSMVAEIINHTRPRCEVCHSS